MRSRHPLWDQSDVHSGETHLARLTEALGRWPLHWRAAITTGLVEARPEEIFRVSGPSIWPFITAAGIIVIFASEIFSLRLLVLGGALVTVAGLIGWHWPHHIPVTQKELAFEREVGIQVRPNGSRAVARWGMGLLILVLAVALTVFLFSYIFLRLESHTWPPEGLPLPNLLLPAMSFLLVVLGGGAMRWAHAQIARDNQI